MSATTHIAYICDNNVVHCLVFNLRPIEFRMQATIWLCRLQDSQIHWWRLKKLRNAPEIHELFTDIDPLRIFTLSISGLIEPVDLNFLV